MDLTQHLQELKKAIDGETLMEVVEILKDAKKLGKTVYTFGNGGSHSTASHFACDLLKACGIKAVCISDMIPSAYAYMNDEGKEVMFDAILCTLQEPGDVIIAFSCSGNSPNVVEALWASSYVTTVLFTGSKSSTGSQRADVVITVYNDNMRIQESVHLAYCHAIVEELLDGTL